MCDFAQVHPGEILLEDFMIPLQIDSQELENQLEISSNDVELLLQGKQSITPTLAEKLGTFWATTSQFWSTLQKQYER